MPSIQAPGMAKKVPAGSRLLLQMHYTPNGKATTDQSEVGIIFAPEPPKHRILTHPLASIEFIARKDKIPANDGNYKMEVTYEFPKDAHIVSFMPHMHLRGKDFLYEVTYPDGKKETLLSLPRYDFNWQSSYRSEKPLAMPKGTKLRCVAHFDNSDKNPNNPDPSKVVFWGEQTWEEMMIGWFDYFWDE
jgi:hypothetical protein